MVIPIDTKLKFAPFFSETKTHVLAVTEEMVSRAAHGMLKIKTDDCGVCFICDGLNTYRIRLVENSNTQFAALAGTAESRIETAFPGIIALDPIYCREIPDTDIEASFMKHTGSKNIVRYISNETIWSESRILVHMSSNHLYRVYNGIWMRMSSSTFFCYMDLILKTCTIVGKAEDGSGRYNSEQVWVRMNEILQSENDTELDGPSINAEVSLSLVQYLLSRFSEDDSDVFKNKGESEWPLYIGVDSMKVVRFRSQQILFNRFTQNNRLPVNISKFLGELTDILATTASVDSRLLNNDGELRSLVPELIEKFGTVDGDLILPFDPSRLPIDLDNRISELFKTKSRWLKKEFETIVSSILAPDAKVESILMKFCRIEVEDDGQTYYSSKF